MSQSIYVKLKDLPQKCYTEIVSIVSMVTIMTMRLGYNDQVQIHTLNVIALDELCHMDNAKTSSTVHLLNSYHKLLSRW